MNSTLTHSHEIEAVDPADPTILVRLNPATLSEVALLAIRMACEPNGREGDDFRGWLLDRVVKEIGRRQANNDGTDGEPLEAEAWALPWHKFTDGELRAALIATFTWATNDFTGDTQTAFREIHAAVVAAAATRLGEIDAAIKLAQKRNR